MNRRFSTWPQEDERRQQEEARFREQEASKSLRCGLYPPGCILNITKIQEMPKYNAEGMSNIVKRFDFSRHGKRQLLYLQGTHTVAAEGSSTTVAGRASRGTTSGGGATRGLDGVKVGNGCRVEHGDFTTGTLRSKWLCTPIQTHIIVIAFWTNNKSGLSHKMLELNGHMHGGITNKTGLMIWPPGCPSQLGITIFATGIFFAGGHWLKQSWRWLVAAPGRIKDRFPR